MRRAAVGAPMEGASSPADARFRAALLGVGPLVVVVPFVVVGLALAATGFTPAPPAAPLLRGVGLAVAAVALAAPAAFCAAAFVTVVGPARLRGAMARLVALSSSVPTVVLGAFAYFAAAPAAAGLLHGRLADGTVTTLSTIAALAMAVAPTIANVGRRLALAVPERHVEAALALGATPTQVAQRLIFPGVAHGLVGALLLALGRAAAEASAVLLLLEASPAASTAAALAARRVFAGGAALEGFGGAALPLLAVTFVAQFAGRALIEGTRRRLAEGA